MNTKGLLLLFSLVCYSNICMAFECPEGIKAFFRSQKKKESIYSIGMPFDGIRFATGDQHFYRKGLFNQEKFEKALASFSIQSQLPPFPQGSKVSVEEKLAWIQAVTKRGLFQAFDFATFSKNASIKELEVLRDFVKSWEIKGPLTPTEIRSRFSKLLQLTHSNPLSWVHLKEMGLNGSLDVIVKNHVTEILTLHEATRAFEKLGMLETKAMRESFAKAKTASAPYLKAVLSAMSFPAVAHGVPGYVPTVGLSAGIKLSEKTIDLLIEKGVEAAMPELIREFGPGVKSKFYINTIIGIYTASMMVVYQRAALEQIRDGQKRAEEESKRATEEFIDKVHSITDPILNNELDLYESTLETIREMYGREPTDEEKAELRVLIEGAQETVEANKKKKENAEASAGTNKH